MPEITIKTKNNQEFMAYVAEPVTDIAAPAVLVIQEIFGVNENMRVICDNMARIGYVAVCPDLFWRQEPGIQLTDKSQPEWDKAFELYKNFDQDLGVEDLISTLETIRESDKCNGYVGTMGYCLGGMLSYLMATRSDADCNVSYYGVGIEEKLDEAHQINTPLLMHIAELDKFSSPQAQEKIIKTMERFPDVDPYIYEEVDHAFARVDGEHFDQQAANLANMRTADFLATHLSQR